MSYSKKEREEYNRRRDTVAKKMGFGKNEYNYYRRVAGKLSDADTNSANGTHGSRHHYEPPRYVGNKIANEYTEKHYNKDVNEAFKKAGDYRKKKGHKIHFYHQSDPRGASLYVSKERMSHKDYNQKGHHIY